MPVLCDFVVIQGDASAPVGDGHEEFDRTFSTGGRVSYDDGGAFLLLSVRGLTHTDRDVDVQINGVSVGHISHYGGQDETAGYWFTQIIHFPSIVLNDGNNRFEIRAVTWPGATPTNRFDDFDLKDVICFFKQEA
jgi:hypothetical protein